MKCPDVFEFDGHRVPLHAYGSGPVRILFLPGMGVHAQYYEDSLRRVARYAGIISPDLSFRGRQPLPKAFDRYRELARSLARACGPVDLVAGHSFGGLLALLGDTPAIALSPTVPLRIGWPRKIWRAVRMQLREYAGLEGRRGPAWAFRIMCDYAATVTRRPGSLFPPVGETMNGGVAGFVPTTPAAHIVLAERDRLYRRAELDRYLEASSGAKLTVRWVARGHGWPVTDPDLFSAEISRVLGNIGAGGRDATAPGSKSSERYERTFL